MRPIALQLYSIRDSLAKDFEGSIRRIAAMGYAGVETAGFPGATPQAAAGLFRELGLTVVSAHSPLPLGDQKNEVLDAMAALGCKRLVLAYLPREEFQSADQIKRNCDRLNEADAIARANGLTLYYHNHWWECDLVDGHPAYQVMLERLAPTVHFEVDTYWVKTGGLDPASVLQELGERATLVHIKDGPCTVEAPMVAVGAGILDWRAIILAARSADWLIVELDRCATDMMQAVEDSFKYLTKEGFGHGRED